MRATSSHWKTPRKSCKRGEGLSIRWDCLLPDINIGVALPAYKRALHKTLQPLQHAKDIGLYISVDSKADKAMFDFENLGIYKDKFRDIKFGEAEGLVANTFNALSMAFSDGCDWVIYLEDDLVPSKDLIDLARYHIRNNPDKTLSFCNLESGTNASRLFVGTDMIGWGFLINKGTFDLIKEAWFVPPMWDLSVAKHLKELGHQFVFPEVSRIKHMGSDGTHITNEAFNADLQKKLRFYEGEYINYYYI